MDEPAPARRAGTADMIDAVIGDMVNEIPIMKRQKPPIICRYDVVASSHRKLNIPSADSPMPMATVRLAPMRALIRGVCGATTIISRAVGIRRVAAPSAE